MAVYEIKDGADFEKDILEPAVAKVIELTEERARDEGGKPEDYLADCVDDVISYEIFDSWEKRLSCIIEYENLSMLLESAFERIRDSIFEDIDAEVSKGKEKK